MFSSTARKEEKVLLRVQFDPVALFALQIPRKSNDLRVVAHTDVKPAIPADLLLACTGCGRLTGFQERGVGIGAFGIGHSWITAENISFPLSSLRRLL